VTQSVKFLSFAVSQHIITDYFSLESSLAGYAASFYVFFNFFSKVKLLLRSCGIEFKHTDMQKLFFDIGTNFDTCE